MLRLRRIALHMSAARHSTARAELCGRSGGTGGYKRLGACAVAAHENEDDRPVVVLLEPPADDALEASLVEEAFATHDLRALWATDNVFSSVASTAVALVTVKKRVDEQILKFFPSLRIVAVAFTGYDHVDLDACKKRGVAVASVPDYSTDGAAELCFGLIISLLRHIVVAHQHVRSGNWAWPPGNELAGKRLGVVGTGAIGMRVAEIGKAFKMSKALAYDPRRNSKFEEILGGEYVQSLATLFLHADVIVVTCELTSETRGMIGKKLLRLLRPESILINCARGAILDQEALVAMLVEGRFRAGLDVYDVEPLPVDHPLRSLPESHLVLTPHLGYKCHESLIRRQDVTLANILAFLADSPQNIVG